MDPVKRSFPPVTDAGTRVLILGSLPGEESLARQRYYAHPRNQFWRLVGAVAGVALEPLAYEARLEALLARGIERNALADLVESLPELRAVGFNGGKSAALGIPQLSGREGLALLPLPSSSPAFTLPFEDKLAQWRQLGAFLA
ncbi:MAG TPA: uracil-DNA glycosylase family protein [Allosphingosinicella sp.]|nr:uracil-DNA glycosylase family protein [Allosphingosinicella sp.]